MNKALIGLVALAVLLVVAASSLFTVHQTQQVLVTQFGQPVRVIQAPGLHTKPLTAACSTMKARARKSSSATSAG
jgi:regulator of protease activity HflC (stomatin/prohibitin superfamily)